MASSSIILEKFPLEADSPPRPQKDILQCASVKTIFKMHGVSIFIFLFPFLLRDLQFIYIFSICQTH